LSSDKDKSLFRDCHRHLSYSYAVRIRFYRHPVSSRKHMMTSKEVLEIVDYQRRAEAIDRYDFEKAEKYMRAHVINNTDRFMT